MGLAENVADLTTASQQLTQAVNDQLANINAAVAQAQADVGQFVQDGAANFPITPNMVRDTKKFAGICGGALNTIQPWNTALASPWAGLWLTGAIGTLDFEVVFAGDEVRLGQLGLWPLDPDLTDFIQHLPNNLGQQDWGVDHHILVMDCTVNTAATPQPGNESGQTQFSLTQAPDGEHHSWFRGHYRTQTSIFTNVLSATGDLSLLWQVNRTWQTPLIGLADVGLGWKHYHGFREGLGGLRHNYFYSQTGTPGHLKIAICAPYSGYGYHQGIPIWTGSVGEYDLNDYL